MPARPSPAAGFTMVELMIAMALSAVVLVATLSGIFALQKSYAATEEYANGLADQMRLLDSLAQDLRRAVAVPAGPSAAALPAWSMDADGQGLTINVPNYYSFNASDPQHLFPVANVPVYNSSTSIVSYQDPANSSLTTQQIHYRFSSGSITRADPFAPLIAGPVSGSYLPAAPVVIASNMDAFPTITPDPSQSNNSVVHYSITFHSMFQILAVPDATNAITLHNVTFVRSQDLAH